MLLPAVVVDEMEQSSISAGSNIGGHIRSCKYSQVLLMMGEDIARNMYS
jgi:hypothetical protein